MARNRNKKSFNEPQAEAGPAAASDDSAPAGQNTQSEISNLQSPDTQSAIPNPLSAIAQDSQSEISNLTSQITSDAPPPDTAQIRPLDYPRQELPPATPGRKERFQAIIRQSVLNQIHRHGLAAQEIEVCGVLVGNILHDSSGPWAYVEYAIEGNHAAGRSTQVTFTADTWAHIQSIMDRDHASRKILGWYHTHPGFGIFLSEMDVFIQKNFFPEPWQIALVYDPKANEEGVFLWKQGVPEAEAFLVEPDAPEEQLTAIVNKAKDVSSGAKNTGDFATLAARLESLEKRQKVLVFFMALVAVVALAWPIAVTTWLPDLLKRSTTPPPPVKLPNYNDPTSRPLNF